MVIVINIIECILNEYVIVIGAIFLSTIYLGVGDIVDG